MLIKRETSILSMGICLGHRKELGEQQMDPRYKPARFRGAPAPVRVSRARGDGDLAERKRLHRDGEEKNQYTKKVSVQRERTARE